MLLVAGMVTLFDLIIRLKVHAFLALIGAALMESGAADRIARPIIWLFGERRAALAMAVSGYLLGVPVFFDSDVKYRFSIDMASLKS